MAMRKTKAPKPDAPIGGLEALRDLETPAAAPPPPPAPLTAEEEAFRREFIDRAAIAVYANGWPLKNVYLRARQLWEQRVKEGIR